MFLCHAAGFGGALKLLRKSPFFLVGDESRAVVGDLNLPRKSPFFLVGGESRALEAWM